MAINDVALTAGMRSNLVSLQGTVDLLNRTQERLSTGKKVNTALDNPLNYFTAKALNSRASDLAAFKDGMSEAVQTIKAANTGITAIEGLLAQAKAVASTAKAGTANVISSVTVDLASVTAGQTISIGGQTLTAVASDNWVRNTINFSWSLPLAIHHDRQHHLFVTSAAIPERPSSDHRQHGCQCDLNRLAKIRRRRGCRRRHDDHWRSQSELGVIGHG